MENLGPKFNLNFTNPPMRYTYTNPLFRAYSERRLNGDKKCTYCKSSCSRHCYAPKKTK
jgi:hypothetical protein